MKKYGIYIHIPFCKSKCAYCSFVSCTDFGLQKSYVSKLIEEINAFPREKVPADTVYIGGGTPSCLYRGGLCEIFAALKSKFDIDQNAEITVECNPESADTEFFDECAACGVNRISMGLQSAGDRVLCSVGRIHTFSDYAAAAERVAARGFDFSSDIILGLPEQIKSDVVCAIDEIAKLCNHVSVYALSVERGTPLFARGYTVDDDFVADLYDEARQRLSYHGFERYEVSNFSRRGRVSRHNIKYWRCDPYVGFGVAAHGYDGWDTRYEHGNDIVAYLADFTPQKIVLSAVDMYNEYIMLALRTERGINRNDFSNRFGYDIYSKCGQKIDTLCSVGCLFVSEHSIKIAPDKMYVMNGIIEELMLDPD